MQISGRRLCQMTSRTRAEEMEGTVYIVIKVAQKMVE